MSEEWGYSDYNSFNRFENLDNVEPLIIEHFIHSNTKHADLFWKILKYNDLYALNRPSVSEAERRELVSDDNGEQATKRLFFSPFTNDALEDQCSSVHVYLNGIKPEDHLRATIGITVQAIVHSKISVLAANGDPTLNPDKKDEASGVVTQYGANPNESDSQGFVVVPYKNRATVLMKCILAELNGLFLDGIGYLKITGNSNQGSTWNAYTAVFNGKAFTGYEIRFGILMSGFSDDANIGY